MIKTLANAIRDCGNALENKEWSQEKALPVTNELHNADYYFVMYVATGDVSYEVCIKRSVQRAYDLMLDNIH